MNRRLLHTLALSLCALCAVAQSGTNSPYSQFGLGTLAEQTSGFNRGMNGLALGFREHNQINYLNPASYSAIDSLSFIFDVGVSGQLTNFEELHQKKNAKNADLEYIVAGFRAFRHLGMSFGIIPFTTVGYDYALSSTVGGAGTTVATNTYAGSGGLHQVFLGAGWEPLRGLSIGVNASYLWGSIDRSVTNSYSDTYANTISKQYSMSVNSYKIDIGAQYTAPLSKKDRLTLGVTYTPGHKVGGDPQCLLISTNTQQSVADTTTLLAGKGLAIPDMIGAGLAFAHAGRWRVGADYTLQRWADVETPTFSMVADRPQYAMQKTLKDRHKFTLGGEYCHDEYGRSFFKRLRYRAGVSYATPYVTVNGQDGPKELSASLGFGIPIVNAFNNRSILNISGQWVRSNTPGLIRENVFRINIGLTFNERWFAKWKVE